eukprot:TRINITY_DN4138_c0_g1_i3.p1 TRINITY_DN4138_c0_g1~~TRINITY_DN4138_c0_g1_i3.p1  ORF type:complete len:238 (+),score=54.30 TRINITY_DN4138_c0_g1_i3:219-932(+)
MGKKSDSLGSGLFKVEVAGRSLSIVEKPELNSTGTKVWESSVVLSKYLEHTRRRNPLKGKKVVELGAGCGIVGMTAGVLGGRVTCTDIQPAFSLLKTNVDRNKDAIESAGNGGNCVCIPLDWTKPLDSNAFSPPYNVILASECVYAREIIRPFIDTLVALCSRSTKIFVSLVERDPSMMEDFYACAKEHFSISKIALSKQHPEYKFDYIKLFTFSLKTVASPSAPTLSPVAVPAVPL